MIDSHAHVTFSQFDGDRDEVVKRAQEAGVRGWIEIGTSVEQSRKVVKYARENDNVWATVGVHPDGIAKLQSSDWKEMEKLLGDDSVVAVGEVGLDYFRGGTREDQLPVLKRFVDMAVESDLPVVWHVRSSDKMDANDDIIKFLEKRREKDRPKGVMHTFSGTQEQAARYLELGMYLAFSGIVTFKNAGINAEVARTAPLNRVLIETDCPFLAPDPYRGQRNELSYVRLVAEKIAELKEVDAKRIGEQTTINTKGLFGI